MLWIFDLSKEFLKSFVIVSAGITRVFVKIDLSYATLVLDQKPLPVSEQDLGHSSHRVAESDERSEIQGFLDVFFCLTDQPVQFLLLVGPE